MSIKVNRLVYAAIGPLVIGEAYEAVKPLYNLPTLSPNKVDQLFKFMAVLRSLKTYDRMSEDKCKLLGISITLADKAAKLGLVNRWNKRKKTYLLNPKGKAFLIHWSEAISECITFYVSHATDVKTSELNRKRYLQEFAKRIGSLSGFDRKF
jgi:hypothetical protein